MENIVSLREPNDRSTKLNVLGKPIEICSCDPMTGWFRDGTCSTEEGDQGHHVICCVLTDEFLEFSKDSGNDLSTPKMEFGFPGLKAGNHWCLCAARWRQAYLNKKAPRVVLEATHLSALEVVTMEMLKEYQADALPH